MSSLVVTMFIFVIVIGLALLIFITLTRRGGSKVLDQAKYRSRWLSITQNAGSTSDSWQFAIISADKLLDTALRERGLPGVTMGDRLKGASGYLNNIDQVWRAHKLRNRIAHDDEVVVSKRQTTEALQTFKKALTDLGAL